ncbi:NDP-hexose 2,3-dehydratase family protein [Streptomyces sp. NPDC087856]|uniref:NDP-hexose 2,3-dehydratase family protein n=1 Tax=Streptomyces sp. NPDC087856 TaxID=3365811 RepID=UPI00380DDDB6
MPEVRGTLRQGMALRLAESEAVTDSRLMPNHRFPQWFAERSAAHDHAVRRVPFATLKGWRFDPGTGNLGHDSGRFFTVEGLRVRTDDPRHGSWRQPILNQPEIGILGIVVREFEGVLHCLMQAKMEPGNINLVQLSPTVQATRSNYTMVHGGRRPRHLEFFTGDRPVAVVADSLQSEHGHYFLRKRNRNMIVEVMDGPPEHEDFCWLTVGQLLRLLHQDNLVNMDARTVLSCLALADPAPGQDRAVRLLNWMTEMRTRHELVQTVVPLHDVPRWRRSADTVGRADGRGFSIVAVEVAAASREVAGWSQPLLRVGARSLAALAVRRGVDGELLLLVHARQEPGLTDVVELGPTVQCVPDHERGLPPEQATRYLDRVLAMPAERVRCDVVHSEEGGRFDQAETRYLVVEAPDGFDEPLPDDYRWAPLDEVTALLRHSYCVNVQLRTLLLTLRNGLWPELHADRDLHRRNP